MTEKEAIKKKRKIEEKIEQLYKEILRLLCIELVEYFPYDILADIKDKLDEPAYMHFYNNIDFEFMQAKWDYVDKKTHNITKNKGLLAEKSAAFMQEFENATNNVKILIDEYFHLKYDLEFGIDKRTDMEMEFDGDIIITDPCYIIREGAEDLEYEIAEPKTDISRYGFTSYMKRDTLYGDWTCTTYDARTGGELGHFAADGGMVGVFLLDEIKKYNPNYKDVENGSWCVTCIRNFKGIVEFKVEEKIYEDGTKMDEIRVYGHGVHNITGDPIDFIGTPSEL